jgi:hypothetical protein
VVALNHGILPGLQVAGGEFQPGLNIIINAVGI